MYGVWLSNSFDDRATYVNMNALLNFKLIQHAKNTGYDCVCKAHCCNALTQTHGLWSQWNACLTHAQTYTVSYRNTTKLLDMCSMVAVTYLPEENREISLKNSDLIFFWLGAHCQLVCVCVCLRVWVRLYPESGASNMITIFLSISLCLTLSCGHTRFLTLRVSDAQSQPPPIQHLHSHTAISRE